MTLTPRQIAAYIEFNATLEKLDRAADLSITALGAQGDNDAINKAMRELTG